MESDDDFLPFRARHAVAQDEGLVGSGAAVALFIGQLAHAGVKEPAAFGRIFFGAGGGEVAVGEAFLPDGLGGGTVQVEPIALAVELVPAEVEPVEPVEDGVDRGLGVPFDIGVVQAQHDGAAVVAGVEPIENEGAGAADVQVTGG